MKSFPASFIRRMHLIHFFILIATVMPMIIIYILFNNRSFASVGITGVHHMGENFAISEFYLNGYWGGNISREGGGGGVFCCIMLPDKWSPGLVGDLRWSVSDWSKEDKEQTAVGNYMSVDWKFFKAIVPVEKYDGEPQRVYVHFFEDGRARIVSSAVGSGNSMHPIRTHDRSAVTVATKGVAVKYFFTETEIKKDIATKEGKNVGNWK